MSESVTHEGASSDVVWMTELEGEQLLAAGGTTARWQSRVHPPRSSDGPAGQPRDRRRTIVFRPTAVRRWPTSSLGSPSRSRLMPPHRTGRPVGAS